jgi:hypothetical protein
MNPESHELSGLAQAHRTTMREYLERLQKETDLNLRWQMDPDKKALLQGRAQLLQDLLTAMKKAAEPRNG